jgi:alkanesulfonate monooxygenase SsuD/methylene tetrahydromethanopterin reductase-like flavin-dependent oxidoreductase (luciferase family)
VQSPRPPIILGGAGRKRGAALAAKYADEFNVGFSSPDETRATFDRVRAAASETGRDLVYSAAQTVCIGRDEAELDRRAKAIGLDADALRANGVAGTPQQALERIAQFTEIGATRMYLQVLDLADLDHLELIANEVLPHV